MHRLGLWFLWVWKTGGTMCQSHATLKSCPCYRHCYERLFWHGKVLVGSGRKKGSSIRRAETALSPSATNNKAASPTSIAIRRHQDRHEYDDECRQQPRPAGPQPVNGRRRWRPRPLVWRRSFYETYSYKSWVTGIHINSTDGPQIA